MEAAVLTPLPSTLAAMVRRLASHSSLSGAERAKLLDLPHRLVSLDRGKYIASDKDTSNPWAVLLTGFASSSQMTGEGSRQIVAVHLQGDLLNAQNCFVSASNLSLQALTKVHVAYIPASALLDVVSNHPAIAQALWRDALVQGAISREWISNLGRRDARARIAHLLCEIATRQKAAGLSAGSEYQWPMTQSEIADAVGLTTVHVNRILQGLRADKLIELDRGRMVIHDWFGLKSVGDFTGAYLPHCELVAA
jgi:CRP-like cAMP-binding protein